MLLTLMAFCGWVHCWEQFYVSIVGFWIRKQVIRNETIRSRICFKVTLKSHVLFIAEPSDDNVKVLSDDTDNTDNKDDD